MAMILSVRLFVFTSPERDTRSVELRSLVNAMRLSCAKQNFNAARLARLTVEAGSSASSFSLLYRYLRMRYPSATLLWSAGDSRRKEQRAVRKLKRVIWSLDEGPLRGSLDPYADHYKRLLAVKTQLVNLQAPSDVVELVRIIKREKQQTVEGIRKSLLEGSPSCLPQSSSNEALDGAIMLGVQLWLFTEPDLADGKSTLQECVFSALSTVTRGSGDHSKDVLSSDFCEKSLTRKGGISIVWTSDLLEHLTFESKSRLRVFRHASALRLFNNLKSEER
jgi:hypothetical protein